MQALETAVQDQVINEKERHDKLEVLIRRRQAEEFKELLEQQAKDLAEYLDLCRQEMQAVSIPCIHLYTWDPSPLVSFTS